MYNYCEEGMSFVASGDLSGMQGRVVDLIASGNGKIGHALLNGGFGILNNKPRSLEHAVVITDGVVKARAAGTVSAGNFIYAALSGWCAVHTPFAVTDVGSAGSVLTKRTILGRALTGAASGFDFALKLRVQETLVLS